MIFLILKNIRDTILLIFPVLVAIPYFIHDRHVTLWPHDVQAQWFGSVPFSIGVLGLLAAVVQFAAASKSSFGIWAKKEHLVVVGLYSYVRNPMFISSFLILVGEALLFDSFWIGSWSVAYFIVTLLLILFFEEDLLEKNFRVVYNHYRKRVPRLFPNTEPYKQPKFRSSVLDKIKHGSRSKRSSSSKSSV